MRSYGYDLSGYKFAISFVESDMASMYLQRTLGIPAANQLVREEKLPIWYWEARWFRPLQKEEFTLQRSPSGEVVGFLHRIEENAPGAKLSQEEARGIAEDYLSQNQGLALSDWEEVSASSEDQPGGRTDQRFEWKKRSFQAGESELRIGVTVQGERVGAFDYWVKVPESFTRRYDEQSSRASFLDGLSTILGIGGFTLAAVLFLGLGFLNHWRPRRSAAWAALIVGVVSMLSGLNMLPLYKISYATTQDYTQYWFEILLYGFLGLIVLSSYIFLLWGGGERISKLTWPRQNKILMPEDDGWVALARSTWRGLMMAGILGGYVVIFYLIATRVLGGWSPWDVSYSDVYATPLPFLFPISLGVMAAFEEEALFRLVGVSLVQGLTRRRWLALLIPGALWAFAHTTYVRDPYYMRGIEILIPAVFLYGLFFLQFDLTTTIVAHLTYNATLGMLPMLRSGEPYFVFSSAVVILFLLAPLAPGLWRLLRRRLRGRQELSLRISEAEVGDLPSLKALPIEGIDWEARLENPAALEYCLKAGEQVVGLALGRIEDGEGWVDLIYVAPSWRERYLGSALLDAVCQALEERGAQAIHSAVPAHDQQGLSFMAGQGWRKETHTYARCPQPTLYSLWQEVKPRRPFIKVRRES
jgi:GNAT superfamily N-acetyltransferase